MAEYRVFYRRAWPGSEVDIPDNAIAITIGQEGPDTIIRYLVPIPVEAAGAAEEDRRWRSVLTLPLPT